MRIITYAESLLVKRHRGVMRVILTCPHDGTQSPPGVEERTEEETPAGCQFTRSRDLETAQITESVVHKIFDLTGLSPYVVIANFNRRFIDANRPVECAFTDSDARPFYDEYHRRITGYVNEIRVANATTPENASVDGGFTVRHYGAFINSIQVELADTVRLDEEKRLFVVEDLAFSIINFVRRYALF